MIQVFWKVLLIYVFVKFAQDKKLKKYLSRDENYKGNNFQCKIDDLLAVDSDRSLDS